MTGGPRIERLAVSAYSIPTEAAESDGTLEWASTTLVLVEVSAGGASGLGYSYADTATALLIRDRLAELVLGQDAFCLEACRSRMRRALRNLGTSGIAAMAVSAVDTALWDLKAKLLRLSLSDLLGPARSAVELYGSGGFTSYSIAQLTAQLGAWVAEGIPRVKLKVGREPTGFLKAAALSQAYGIPLSSHGAPALHVQLGCAVPGFSVLEYFHDHVRIEQLLFDGAARPCGGKLKPDRSRPGLGLDFKRQDAAAYAA